MRGGGEEEGGGGVQEEEEDELEEEVEAWIFSRGSLCFKPANRKIVIRKVGVSSSFSCSFS